ncbi:MAG TPA: tetratricopeptide repeat protein [Terriglobales bacterium]|nr:tetratricopeptide repeat protein [Terriglobales bacterium]
MERPYYFSRRFDQAIAVSQKTLELDPNFSLSHLRLGRAYAAKGMFAEAIHEGGESGRHFATRQFCPNSAQQAISGSNKTAQNDTAQKLQTIVTARHCRSWAEWCPDF